MRSPAAARRYARALFALAREDGSIDRLRGELAAIDSLLEENEELHAAILQPIHPSAERRKVLRALCERLGTSEVMQKFSAFLVDQRRVIDFGAIRQAFDQLADLEAGRTRAHVVSATPLRPEQRDRLRRALEARTGQQVELEEGVDPTLLGGAIASVGGLVFDGSLRTQLAKLRTSLTRGQ